MKLEIFAWAWLVNCVAVAWVLSIAALSPAALAIEVGARKAKRKRNSFSLEVILSP
jgi:hypothetical protein